jgi:hypothetical protein
LYAEFAAPLIDTVYWWSYGLAILLYIIIYLGIGRLIIHVARRYARFGSVVGFLIQAVVAGLGGVIPATVQFALFRIFGDDYTLLQIPNWGWTLAELADSDYFFLDHWLVVFLLAGSVDAELG